MENKTIYYAPHTKEYAKSLRNKATQEENALWFRFLRTYPIHFYRQKRIGTFIVDFYCAKAKLVVELDGSQHYSEDGSVYDKERTAYLNALGYEVLRFTNLDITRNFQDVCNMIDGEVRKRVLQTKGTAGE